GRVTAVSVGLTALGLGGISFSTSIWMTIASSIPLGIGAGAVDAGLNDYVARHYKPQYMNWLHSFWGVGVTIGPLVMSAFLADGGDWRGGYRTIAIVQSVLCLVLFLSLPLWKKSARIHAERAALRLQVPPRAHELEVPGARIRPIRIPGVALAMVGIALYCAVENTLGTWGASFLVATRSIDPAVASRWIAFYYGGIMVGRIIAGFVAMRLSDKTMIRLGMVVVAVGIAVLALPFGAATTFLGLLLVGLGAAPVFPGFIHATADRFGEKYAPDIVGFQMGAAYFGVLVIQPLAGQLFARTTFDLLPYALFLFAVLQIAATEALNRKLAR
ncbi:MAG: MFS transporter, partial [Candidatus Izemoplasmatales bacterium]